MQTYKLLADDETLTAGAVNFVSDKWKVPMAAGGMLLIKITNGSTGPSAAASVQILYSYDGTTTNEYHYGGALVGNTDALGSESWPVPIDPDIPWVWIEAGGNTGQDVTLRVEAISHYSQG